MYKPKELNADLIGIYVIFFILIILPFFGLGPYALQIITLCMLLSAVTCSWNLINGYGGMFTFGHQAFYAVGGYLSALLAIRLGISPWVGMFVAAGVTALLGVVVGIIVFRIRSLAHLAIVTLALAEIVRLIISNLTDLTRGMLGLVGIPSFPSISLPFIGEIAFGATNRINLYYLMLIILAVTVIITYCFARGRIGLAVAAIRGSEDAAGSLGIKVNVYKLMVFAISSGLAGACGAFYAHYYKVLTPEAIGGVSVMVQILVAALIGGLGTLSGPIIGGFFVIGGLEILRAVGDWRMVVYGAVLIVAITFARQGVWPKVRDLIDMSLFMKSKSDVKQ